jgi:hypothetical protein
MDLIVMLLQGCLRGLGPFKFFFLGDFMGHHQHNANIYHSKTSATTQ